MKKYCLLIAAAASSLVAALAQNVVIKSPGYFTEPIRAGQPVFPDSLVYPADAEEIVIPDVTQFGWKHCSGKFTRLRKVTFGDVDYLPGGLFMDMPDLEEVVFDGMVGHFDCTFILSCPRLKSVVFRGPISSTGGPGLLSNTPAIEKVAFESVVVDPGIEIDRSRFPKLQLLTDKAAFLSNPLDSLTPVATADRLHKSPRLKADMERLARWQSQALTAPDAKWMLKTAYSAARILQPVLAELGSPMADSLKAAMDYAWNLGDHVKTTLEILKESPAYAADTLTKPVFRYAAPDDSLLTETRRRFNLDSIAGNGDDISRIKNLLYWLHNNIPHDGSNGLAPGPRTLSNTYDCARRDSCDYNCRALAICLTEALLAEGIPARYLTCQSKHWDTDDDCHVICVAWSSSLNKWIWVDPTFAAYITDENGLLLHPGEVRYRLQHGLPLVLNDDANWNNEFKKTQDDYLDYYMAKNLYIMSANTLNQARPEGPASQPGGRIAALVPLRSDYTNAHFISTDEAWFWQPPTQK